MKYWENNFFTVARCLLQVQLTDGRLVSKIIYSRLSRGVHVHVNITSKPERFFDPRKVLSRILNFAKLVISEEQFFMM